MNRPSLFAPVLLIAVGALLLVVNFRSDLSLSALFASSWPWLLVFWGGFRVMELAAMRLLGRPAPEPMGAGAVIVALLLVVAGSVAHGVQQRNVQFPRWTDWLDGPFGVAFTFPAEPLELTVSDAAETLVIREVRGRLKVIAVDTAALKITGRKKTSALSGELAKQRAGRVSLALSELGSQVVLTRRLTPGPEPRGEVSFDIEAHVPRGLGLRLADLRADLDVRGRSGGVLIDGMHRSVRLEDIAGPVEVKGRRGRSLRARGVTGNVSLSGGIRRVEIEDIAGEVRIEGDLFPSLRLERLEKPFTIRSRYATVEAGPLTGKAEIHARTIALRGVGGPLKIASDTARRIRLQSVDGAVEIRADRADLHLELDTSRLAGLQATLGRGDIELLLGPGAAFELHAATARGDVHHEFGPAIHTQQKGRSAEMSGTVGEGPRIRLETGRGDVLLRRRDGATGPEQRVSAQGWPAPAVPQPSLTATSPSQTPDP